MLSATKAVLVIFYLLIQNGTFLDNQKTYPRVREVISQKLESVQKLFEQKNVSFPPKNIFIRAFKQEQEVELWAQSSEQDTFQLLKTYKFCSSSGKPGPKRMQGDLQIPEGFYFIDRFNPVSNFHLSLGINYPNESDRILGIKGSLGGDIFIHGDCVTIGCIPITDELIKEVYIITVYSKNNGQEKVPVHIFPARMFEANMEKLESNSTKNISFWNNLKAGYSYFEKHHIIPKISVNKTNGKYILND